MLTEEALILVVVLAALVLLVLGLLELVWPTSPRKSARRAKARETPARPVDTFAPPRSYPSVARPREPVIPLRSTGAAMFPPPARYVEPPRPSEPAAARPSETVAAARSTETAVPLEPPEADVSPRPVVEETVPQPPPDRPLEAPEVAHEPPEVVPEAPEVTLAQAESATPERPIEDVEPARPIEEDVEVVPPRQPIATPDDVTPLTPPPEPVEPPPAEQPAPPSRRRRRSKISPHARPHGVLRGPKPATGRGVDAAPPDLARSGGAGTDRTATGPSGTWSSAPERGAPEATARRDSPLIESCFALYQEKRYSEVVSIGEETLAKLPVESPTTPSHETAALWSVVGLAKQGMGDDDGARAALESALDAAPDGERATYRRHLATLALDAAQARLARAGSHDTGDRIATIRTAITWIERGLAAVPFDPALSDARERAYEALWEGYDQAGSALLQRQEFRGARQLLREVLDDPALPPARAAGFRGLISGTFGGEIGQLTAQAILGMQEGRESEALESLQRAEELLTTIPAEALPPSRRDEVDQRLWWAYAELGSRRLEAGDYEEALDPLLHALRFESIGAERQAETRAAVVRALEGIAAVRAMSIRRLIDAGLRDEAVRDAEQLRTRMKGCLELGLTESELVAAFARVRRLCEELGMTDPD